MCEKIIAIILGLFQHECEQLNQPNTSGMAAPLQPLSPPLLLAGLCKSSFGEEKAQLLLFCCLSRVQGSEASCAGSAGSAPASGWAAPAPALFPAPGRANPRAPLQGEDLLARLWPSPSSPVSTLRKKISFPIGLYDHQWSTDLPPHTSQPSAQPRFP